MLKNEFLPSFENSLPSVPTAQVDGRLKILGVNTAAAHLGVQVGETLSVRTEADVQKYQSCYAACTAAMRETSTGRIGAPYSIRVPLAAFHGFRTALVQLEPSLAGTIATVLLFRTQKEYLHTVAQYTPSYQRSAQAFLSYFDRLREKCAELIAGTDTPREALAASLDELLSALRLSARLLAPLACESEKEKRLFSLSRLLDTYLLSVLPHLQALDCTIDRTVETDEKELLFPVDTGAVFLLLTTLLGILNCLSTDGRIFLSESRYGQDGEIRLSTKAVPAPSPLIHTFDLSAIAAAFPQAEMLCSAAAYLTEITDTYVDFFTSDTDGYVTLSLYIPFEKQTGDFKSPKGADEDLREAVSCMRALLSLDGVFTARSEAAQGSR